MLIQLNKHSGIPVYRQVVEQVTRQIMAGQLAPGDQLESVASLSKRVRVNPMTISKAYSYLVQDGLVERRPGLGLFVLPVRQDRQSRVRDNLLEEAMSKAADLAQQLGLSKEEAGRLFAGYYRNAAAKEENEK